MRTIEFRPWKTLRQILAERRAAERGDTRHAHERAIAGDLDRVAGRHPVAAPKAPASAFPATNRAEVVSAPARLHPKQTEALRDRPVPGHGWEMSAIRAEYRRRHVPDRSERRPKRPDGGKPVVGEVLGVRTEPVHPTTADVVEAWLRWERVTQ